MSDLIVLRHLNGATTPADAQRRRAMELILSAEDQLLGAMVAALEAVTAAATATGARCQARQP